MKKLLFILLLTFPFFLFAQEKQIYQKTMSLSQFVEELKQAAKDGKGYILENCYIRYDNNDKKYLSDNNSCAVIDESLNFNENSLVSIKNCKFGDAVSKKKKNKQGFKNIFSSFSSTITFRNCLFGDLSFTNINADIRLDNITAKIGVSYKITNDYPHTLEILESDINGVYLNCNEAIDRTNIDYEIKIQNSNINFCVVRDVKRFRFLKNKTSTVIVDGYSDLVKFDNNDFYSGFDNIFFLGASNNVLGYFLELGNFSGIEMGRMHKYNPIEIRHLEITKNRFHDISKYLTNDTLLYLLKNYAQNRENKYQARLSPLEDDFGFAHDNDFNVDGYNHKWTDAQKTSFLKKFLENTDSLNIKYDYVSRISIRNSKFDKLILNNNKITECFINNNKIANQLEITKTKADSLMYFYKNRIPDKHNIKIDKSAIHKLGFIYKGGLHYYGNEDYFEVKDKLQEEKFKESFLDLSAQYRQFIAIYHENGSDFKTDAIIALKSFQTNKNMYKYYQNRNVMTFLNWWGDEFLGKYCDYGLSPFKGLRYCFYVILMFSLFYFFFYSDWDKIDREFLINRFSIVVAYFSSDKKIEDFFTDNYEKQMQVPTDFKLLLEQNKVHTPLFLRLLFKPLYQFSFVRYKALNYFFKKVEFMAGKWGNLQLKQRYIIGAITVVVLIFYILYLILIRAVNAIILSLNSFSTLGFGQVPVRGLSFTKYVTVIEGFVGWFLLGTFIVSLLNQMANI